MYRRYNDLQIKQLQEQEYRNTEAVRVVVCAPGRSTLLKASLPRQVHQNYRLVTDPEEMLNASGDVFVIAADDGELMSTALMQFANAVSEGSDFCYCDAVFGPWGETVRLSPERFDLRYGNIAAMSAPLFFQAAEKCGGTSDCLALIGAASALSRHTEHIPLALAFYRREIAPSDVFLSGERRVLVLCHEFSMTGAPLVLVSVIPVLKKMGFDVAVLGPWLDDAVRLFLDTGIPVITDAAQLNNGAIYGLALSCDLVFANCAAEIDAIAKLGNAAVPVIWWLHDSPGQWHMDSPREQMDNISVCAVGEYAADVMRSFRPNYKVNQLLYGLPDYSKDDFPVCGFVHHSGKILFVNVGTIDERKAQDILVKAISLLPECDRERAHFLFVGKNHAPWIYSGIMALTERYPENVSYIPWLSRTEIKSLMDACQCVICSSRSDPMPTFVTEAAMFGKPAIISEHTGTASLITQGKNGFVYRNDDPKELSAMISHVINHADCLPGMRQACRTLYEENFTMEVFTNHLTNIVQEAYGKSRFL